jgi:SAM-dependent MidA family methyltransferase
MKMPNQVIGEEIEKAGVLPFVRFMEIALYCPETGYYERKKDSVGRRGDFVTSVSTGRLYGELLAFQLAGWLEEIKARCPRGSTLQLVEAGAHDGRLAADILGWLQTERPQLFAELEYVLLEPSLQRREWQAETLKPFAPRVRWHGVGLAALKESVHGVILSNELLDAFPIRRFGWDVSAKKWFEWGVKSEGARFAWAKMEPAHLPAAVDQLPAELLQVLPDGYIMEDSPAAENWWREAARALACGKLLAVDYGFGRDELLAPARQRGTLRAYYQHHVADDVLANVGEQDLTAHVNFSAIQTTGEAAGLNTEQFCSQPQFLTRILQRAVTAGSFASLDAKQVRQFQTLTHPEHLGRAFRVLVQGR